MTIKEQLMQDLKDAMRSGDELRRETIRMARAAIKNAEIAAMHEFDDPDVQNVLRKEIKQRMESAEEYQRGHRQDLADKERAEAALIQAYLPEQLSEQEIEAEVRSVVDEMGLAGAGPKAMSKVMPAAMARLKGKADGRTINAVVNRVLFEQP